MKLQSNTTPVPNRFFDDHLPLLSESQLRVLLVVIRQTFGWKCPKTGKRKQRDWIARSQFVKKTGMSGSTISKAIEKLIERGILKATDYSGFSVQSPSERRGKHQIFYTAFPQNAETLNATCAKLVRKMCEIRT